ncbi:MalY/PatB family protein [Arcobacter sp. FWKO B]|uniref:MalY/PatB family protein n=1 Tax=Arcobacter sp. FWKO B TaxID=2593672 RepID=UPI0018A64B80|nr:PatB family C-S lyase [Arcobacter sp. FWKO B]QOG11525.1 putative C-S lyase [Arcobacter sp. FWKO B]
MANFDKLKNRNNTNCVKYDGAKRYFQSEITHPLWVADMDFEIPKFLQKKIKKKCEFGIFGYEEIGDQFYRSIIFWQKVQNNIELKKHNILFSSSVVASLSACVKAFSNIGDEVIVFSPVYYPFFSVIEENKRVVNNQELLYSGSEYTIDFDNLRKTITRKTKLILFCSPHNPIGKIWSEDELMQLADIAVENGMKIVSDEIHCDIVFDKFTSLAKYHNLKEHLIVLNSPSKTFNLAGLSTSYVFSYNFDILRAFKNEISKMHCNHLNSFSNIAIQSYCNQGKEWLDSFLYYIQKNKNFVIEFLKENNSKIKVVDSNATYLLWLDFKALNLTQNEINQRLLNAKIGLNNGESFGKGGTGFMRLNIGTQNKNLRKVLKKLIKLF